MEYGSKDLALQDHHPQFISAWMHFWVLALVLLSGVIPKDQFVTNKHNELEQTVCILRKENKSKYIIEKVTFRHAAFPS